MKRNLVFLPVILLALAVVALAACTTPALPAPVQPPAVEPAATQAAPAANQPTVSATSAPAQATPAAGQPTGSAPSASAAAPVAQATPAAGLPAPKIDALQSFAAQAEFKEEVVKPAATVASWVTMDLSYQAQPTPGVYAMTITDKQSAAGKAAGQMQMVVMGQDAYILTPEQGNKWLKVPMQDNGAASITSDFMDPNKLAEDAPATAFAQANVVDAHEQVAGQDTTHYRFKDAVLAELLKNQDNKGKLLGGQSDMWVSNAGGYVKQYTMDLMLEYEDGQQVHQTGRLLVTDENKPVNIATPLPAQVTSLEGAAAPSGGTPQALRTTKAGQDAIKTVPLPPQGRRGGAADVSAALADAMPAYTTPGLPTVTYLSPARMEDIFAFYRKEMVRLGWQELMNQPGDTLEAPSLLTFEKGDLNLEIVILPDSAKRQNLVLLQVEG